MTLNKRLILGSMLLIFSTLMLTAVLVTYLVNRQFDRYLTETHQGNLQRLQKEVAILLGDGMEASLEDVGLFAVTEGYYMEVLNEAGATLYASQNISAVNMMGRQVSLLQMKNMPMYAGIDVTSYAVEGDDGKSYLLNIGFNRNEGISEDAARFKTTVYYGIAIAMFLSLAVGFILSYVLAKPVGKDIADAAQAAEAIASGDKSGRLPKKASVTEIVRLNNSMNRMAMILSEQEDLRRDLVETVSHEVKTPLTVLKSQVDAFLDGIYEPEYNRLAKCRDEIMRLESLMERMADYDNFSKKAYVLNLSKFDVGTELEALKMILTPQFTKKDLSLDLALLAGNEVVLDRYKFRQIMYNLLSNAFKFSDEHTEVLVRMTPADKVIHIEVINSGLAIDENDRERLFEARFRADAANSKDPHGKGLGLSISKSLAKFMNGDLYLQESSVNRTVFCLDLPKTIKPESKEA